MKKTLLSTILLSLLLCLMIGCKENEPTPTPTPKPEPEIPPTLGDIVATYTNQTLKLTINQEASSQNAAVVVVKEQDSTMTIQLKNVVPGVAVFSMPNSTFEVVTRSMYASKISGSAVDSLAGYVVKIDGKVTDSLLTAEVTLTEMGGELTNTKAFRNKTYKGEMTLNESKFIQRVYTSSPSDRDTSSIKLTIENFSFSGLTLDHIVMDTIKVLKRGTIYAFKSTDQKMTLPNVGEVTFDVVGAFVDDQLDLSIAVNAAPVVLDVTFNGIQVTESSDTKATITIPSDVIVQQPVAKGDNYKFRVSNSTSADKLMLTPNVEIAAGATIDSVVIDHGDGTPTIKTDLQTAIDFSKFTTKSCVKYYVTAEDVRRKSTKSLFVERLGFTALYTMENWVIDAINGLPTPEGLTNSNACIDFMMSFGVDFGGHKPVEKGADGSVEIRTFKTVSPISPQTVLPAVSAGTLFNGSFALDPNNAFKSAKFGEIFEHEPKTLKFTYKYTPGSQYYMTTVGDSIYGGESTMYHYAEYVPDMKDSCSVSAYLYEVSNFDETLDGSNINTSPKVILRAVSLETIPTNSYIDDQIEFKPTGNGVYDPKKIYKLAIVCSSSRRGDAFMGAPGSMLAIKRLEVVTK